MYSESQLRDAVGVATKRTLRRAALGYFVLMAGVAGTYWNGQTVSKSERDAIVNTGKVVTVAGCNRDFVLITSVLGILSASQAQVELAEKRGVLTAPEAAARVAFFSEQIDKLRLPDCRRSVQILSTDPGRKASVPTPLHPSE